MNGGVLLMAVGRIRCHMRDTRRGEIKLHVSEK